LGINNLLQENPGQADLLDILNQTAHQLDDTIHAMNELLTIENESDLKPQQGVNLRQAFLNNIGLLKNLIESAAEIEINIPEDISVRVIPAYLDSIINNLLTNAIKYRKNFQKSHITISAETNQDEVVFKVSDDGIGIDLNKYRNRLFKMRSRFHHGSEGKGLGLFFTKRQIEAMQGSISVESEPDVGSTFTIRLKKS
jgi:signal transduction histidine kinase